MTQATPDFETVVIGGGVVGLAIAASLAERGHEVVVLEKNAAIGQETSARSSEVIHAGLYYPPRSLKARLCVEGRRRLYGFCADNGVGVRQTGKLVVATKPQHVPHLKALAANARENGVVDVALLSGHDVHDMEPSLDTLAALHSPSTGIVDSHALMVALAGHITSRRGMIVCHTEVCAATLEPGANFALMTRNGDAETAVTARHVIAAAGHGMAQLGAKLPRAGAYRVPELHLAKGHYFSLAGAAPFRHLIYPVPEEGGLGIHFTLDLAGAGRFGPDVAWVTSADYGFDDAGHARRRQFELEIRKYWPQLPDNALTPAYTGIRPKLSGPGEGARDFAIDGPKAHGVPGLVALHGIESPGLTAALAIARYVADLLAAG